jgi:hypothetical protein
MITCITILIVSIHSSLYQKRELQEEHTFVGAEAKDLGMWIWYHDCQLWKTTGDS